MILLFVATSSTSGGGGGSTPPELPDLDIADATSGVAVPVAGIEGWDDDYIQTQALCFAPLVFEAEETSLTGEGIEYWARRLSKILVRCSFSDSGATAQIRLVYKDKNDVKSFSASQSITALNIMEGGKYMADLVSFDTYGANKVSVYVESVSSGSVNIQLAGV